MAAHKETKPFNLEHARAGAPISCRNGKAAQIFKWDGRGTQPLVGVYTESDIATMWHKYGQYYSSGKAESVYDLVMTPLGLIDGRPVFTCDLIERDGPDGWQPDHVGARERDFTNCRWPVPEKQYPETAMTPSELSAARYPYEKFYWDKAVANAALRHAIDAGQVVTREEFDRMCGDRGARDIAVAEAVLASIDKNLREQCRVYGGIETYMTGWDLPAIIAEVKQ